MITLRNLIDKKSLLFLISYMYIMFMLIFSTFSNIDKLS